METSSAKVTIDHRFRGPPRSGNGGYTCGLLLAMLVLPLAGQAAPLSTIQINQAEITGLLLTTVQQSQVSSGGTAQAAEASRDQVFAVGDTEFTVSAYAYASPEAPRCRRPAPRPASSATCTPPMRQ
jgi:hypothetical protein